MAGKGRVQFDASPLQRKLLAANPRAKAHLDRVTAYHALRSEAYARINANWIDRTGNARQGLAAEPDLSGTANGRWAIVIYHQVNYGIWLETRFGGRYAIIDRTVQTQRDPYFAAARGVMQAMFG